MSESAFFGANEFETLIPDISEYQPYANMKGIKKVNGGAVIIRMHNGFRNDYAGARHRGNAHSAGFRAVGLYQYVTQNVSVVWQAERFCAAVGKLEAGEFVIMDYEFVSQGGTQLSRAKAWIATVKKLLPGAFIVPYSYVAFIRQYNLASLFTKKDGWVAAYSAVEPVIPHFLWQCTDGVHGVNITDWPGAGKCDTSIYRGTLDELVALIQGSAPPPPPVGKDFLDMADFISLSGPSAAGPIALLPNQWMPVTFAVPTAPRTLVVGPGKLSGNLVIRTSRVPDTTLILRVAEVDVAADGSTKILSSTVPVTCFPHNSCQLSVDAIVHAGAHLFAYAMSPDTKPLQIVQCAFTGFFVREAV